MCISNHRRSSYLIRVHSIRKRRAGRQQLPLPTRRKQRNARHPHLGRVAIRPCQSGSLPEPHVADRAHHHRLLQVAARRVRGAVGKGADHVPQDRRERAARQCCGAGAGGCSGWELRADGAFRSAVGFFVSLSVWFLVLIAFGVLFYVRRCFLAYPLALDSHVNILKLPLLIWRGQELDNKPPASWLTGLDVLGGAWHQAAFSN